MLLPLSVNVRLSYGYRYEVKILAERESVESVIRLFVLLLSTRERGRLGISKTIHGTSPDGSRYFNTQ
jgi:hypothetical protein